MGPRVVLAPSSRRQWRLRWLRRQTRSRWHNPESQRSGESRRREPVHDPGHSGGGRDPNPAGHPQRKELTVIVLQSALSAVADRAGAGATPVITLPCPWRVGCSRLHDCPHRSRDRVMGSTQSRDPDMSPNVHQTSHELLRETLRGAMGAAVGSERGDGGIGSIPWRASAALYALLGAHPVDRRGRCRSCHGLRALLGRGRRICRVLVVARSTCTNPRTSCSASSRASCTSTPRRHQHRSGT